MVLLLPKYLSNISIIFYLEKINLFFNIHVYSVRFDGDCSFYVMFCLFLLIYIDYQDTGEIL